MTSSNPPFPYYNGIAYNSSFFTTNNGSGLTQAKANALYLQKTIADTATALETFSSGIKTDSIVPRTTNGPTLFNDTTGNIIASSICPNNNSSSYGYNNSIVTVGESSKFMRIGGSMPSASGNYILVGGANSQTTNIGIGSNGDVDLLSGTNKLLVGSTGKTVTLTGTTINIGSATSNNYIYNIESPSASTNIILYSTLYGANMSFCDGQVTGILQIGNATGRTGAIVIGASGAGGFNNQILIGDSSKSVNIASGTVGIGGAATTINLAGSSTTNLFLNAPLKPTYAMTMLTSNAQIGYTTELFFANNIINIPNSGQTIATLTIGTAGVYIINFSFRYAGATSTVGNCETWFQSSTGGNIQYGNQAYYNNPNETLGSNVICQSGSAVITATATSTITFYVFITYTGGAPFLDKTYSYYSYTRIA